jgi:anti-anti-sigma regulatory factor
VSENVLSHGERDRARLPSSIHQHRTTVLTIAPLAQQPGLRLIGEVDLATHDLLADALSSMAVNGEDVHLDLSELSFIDLGGATLLVNLATRLGPHRHLVLHRPPQQLRRVIGLLWRDQPTIQLDPQ